MKNKRNLWVLLILLAFVVFFSGTVWRSLGESNRRSLHLQDEVVPDDAVVISATIISVNPATRELTANLEFQPNGKVAEDEVTPRTDLKLLINNIHGKQEYEFPKGKRMNPLEATFSLQGDINRYPLDRYTTTLSFFMTTPVVTKVPVRPPPVRSKDQKKKKSKSQPAELAVGEITLLRNVQVPVAISMSASLPGMKFDGWMSQNSEVRFKTIELRLRRPDNLIVVSGLVMFLMLGLASSVLAMALKAIARGKRLDLLPLSLSISLIFGLPALRSIQPSVPPVGVLGDYLSFLWAELTVAASAIITVWGWWSRAHSESDAKSQS
jgi:hypothetical protein